MLSLSRTDSAVAAALHYLSISSGNAMVADPWAIFDSKEELRPLKTLYEKLFCCTASSCPVERVFSQSSLFIRPHRTRMSKRLLCQLVFLKCNRHLKWRTEFSLLEVCRYVHSILFFSCTALEFLYVELGLHSVSSTFTNWPSAFYFVGCASFNKQTVCETFMASMVSPSEPVNYYSAPIEIQNVWLEFQIWLFLWRLRSRPWPCPRESKPRPWPWGPWPWPRGSWPWPCDLVLDYITDLQPTPIFPTRGLIQ